VAAGNAVKEQGLPNDLITRIAGDPLFGLTETEIRAELDPAIYIGRAPEQVVEFLRDVVRPRLKELDGTDTDSAPDLKV
jgi:adenylosuccinate lyase